MKKVILYTDGACSENPGVGGWAFVLQYKNTQKKVAGGELLTTNNRMELKAVIEGLKALKEECDVEVYSDSAYVVNAFKNDWIVSWQLNNWKNSQKKEVLNRDLWEELLNLISKHKVTFFKVKGHEDNELNNLCDKMAVEQVAILKSKNN